MDGTARKMGGGVYEPSASRMVTMRCSADDDLSRSTLISESSNDMKSKLCPTMKTPRPLLTLPQTSLGDSKDSPADSGREEGEHWMGPAKTRTLINGLTFRSDFDSGNLMKVLLTTEHGECGGIYQLWTARYVVTPNRVDMIYLCSCKLDVSRNLRIRDWQIGPTLWPWSVAKDESFRMKGISPHLSHYFRTILGIRRRVYRHLNPSHLCMTSC